MSEINPITREEIFMAYAAGNTSLTLPRPITRREQFLYAIAQMVASGGATPEQIRSYVSAYLEENPVQAGATTEEADQIRQNTEAIARKIDAPASAAVGQTIVVEAVDEEGKPVSWKTAELPTDGYSIFYIDKEIPYPWEYESDFLAKVSELSNEGDGIKVGDLVITSNGTLCTVARFNIENDRVAISPIANIASSGGNVNYGAENAGKLLYVGADGFATVLALGAGLAIVDGVLTITSQQVTAAICGESTICGNTICGGA